MAHGASCGAKGGSAQRRASATGFTGHDRDLGVQRAHVSLRLSSCPCCRRLPGSCRSDERLQLEPREGDSNSNSSTRPAIAHATRTPHRSVRVRNVGPVAPPGAFRRLVRAARTERPIFARERAAERRFVKLSGRARSMREGVRTRSRVEPAEKRASGAAKPAVRRSIAPPGAIRGPAGWAPESSSILHPEDCAASINFNKTLDFVGFCDLSRTSPTGFSDPNSLDGVWSHLSRSSCSCALA